jgi:hypothetical protein
LLTGIILLSTSVRANDFSFTGVFAVDSDVQFFSFRLDAPSSVSLRSWSYAGGVNASGQLIFGGGFDPILAVFDTTGLKIYENDDGIGVPFDPFTGLAADVLLDLMLQPGDYWAALSQYDNFAGSTRFDPFLRAGTGNFTPLLFPCFATQFCDSSGSARSGFWALDITGVDDAALLPEPSSAMMFGMGLFVFIGFATPLSSRTHTCKQQNRSTTV